MPDHTKQYSTLEDTVKNWRVSAERLKNACEQGDVSGAALLNGEWIIPKDTKRPRLKNLPKTPKPSTKYVDNQGEIIARTPVQEAVINAVGKGENLSGVSEYKIGNVTFVVSSVFQRQGLTLEETMFNRVIHGLQDEKLIPQFPDTEFRKTLDDELDNIRRNSPAFTMTRQEKMGSYRKMLEQYGFASDEIERLMVKIEADYEEPDFDTRFPHKRSK